MIAGFVVAAVLVVCCVVVPVLAVHRVYGPRSNGEGGAS